ncbi:MAG: hypothetical protein ACLTR8_03295 [Oscillospiraceae bacterium]
MKWFFANFLFDIWNAGLTAGLTLGVMLILRPVLCKLLTAQQRAWLGMLGWYGTGFAPMFGLLGWLHILPVTFRDLISRAPGSAAVKSQPICPKTTKARGNTPWPCLEAGRCGGEFSDGIVIALALLWIGVVVALTLWLTRRSNQMKALGRQGLLLADDDPLLFRSLSRRAGG